MIYKVLIFISAASAAFIFRETNDRPVIGVLSQAEFIITDKIRFLRKKSDKNYIKFGQYILGQKSKKFWTKFSKY